jgi:hypothetical protein
LFLALAGGFLAYPGLLRAAGSGQVEEPALVTLEVRYHEAGAGEVFLVWDVNEGGGPEAIRPPGKLVKKEGTNLKRMAFQQDSFVARIQGPAPMPLVFGFWITRDRAGNIIDPVWDGQQRYQALLVEDRTVEISSTVLSRQFQRLESGLEVRLVTQEIRYLMPEAGEVFLVWGVNGWQPVPEEIWPVGTIMNGGLMNTPLAPENGGFVTKVRVPAGALLEYGFLITERAGGSEIEPVWDGRDDYRMRPAQDGVVEVAAGVSLPQNQAAGSGAAGPLVTREVRYLRPEAGEVFLVWGINGWQPVAEAIRPAGTVIEGKLMKTPMVVEGGVFTARLQVPPGATVEYGFTISKDHSGADIKPIWDGSDDYVIAATSSNDVIEVRAGAAEEETPSAPAGDQGQSQAAVEEEESAPVTGIEAVAAGLEIFRFHLLFLAAGCLIFILLWLGRDSRNRGS